jgi:hypothetical protein
VSDFYKPWTCVAFYIGTRYSGGVLHTGDSGGVLKAAGFLISEIAAGF